MKINKLIIFASLGTLVLVGAVFGYLNRQVIAGLLPSVSAPVRDIHPASALEQPVIKDAKSNSQPVPSVTSSPTSNSSNSKDDASLDAVFGEAEPTDNFDDVVM